MSSTLLINTIGLVITGLIEKLLKLTIFLSIPSKMLGIVVGAIEAYFYIFIALLVLNLPFINISMIKESSVANFILEDTLILSNVSEKLVNTYDSVYTIIKERNEKTNTEINEDIVVILLENKIISAENMDKLVLKNKIKIDDKTIIDDYR